MARTQGELNRIAMRHLERAYRVLRSQNSKAWNRERGDSEVESAIVKAIVVLHRQGTPTGI